MPVSSRSAVATVAGLPDPDVHLRAYAFHGVTLSPAGAAPGHVVGDCPFCGIEGAKFSVEAATGVGRCFRCGNGTERGGFNPLVFTRKTYENAACATLRNPAGFLAAVAADRKLLYPETVSAWGVARAADGTWLVPGYGVYGGLPRVDQVYRRVRQQDSKGTWSWRLLPTPGIWPEGQGHGLHMPAGDFDSARPNMVVCEGPWDGMALYEVWDDRDFGKPLLDTNIVAVPGCTTWRDEWTELCRGKCVTLLYDSDHPKTYTVGGREMRAGYDGMVRVAKRLSGVAERVQYVNWGPEGYDFSKPSGWDVRDLLTTS